MLTFVNIFIVLAFCISVTHQKPIILPCPKLCICQEKSVRCHNAPSLTQLDLGALDAGNVEELEIVVVGDDTGADTLLPSTFARFTLLSRLIVRNAALTGIALDTARRLGPSLRVLDLAGNHIRALDELHLDQMPHLQTLQLSNNRIERISAINGASSSLRELHYLGLDNNDVQRVERGALANMPLLLQVTLRGNRRLTDIDDGAFDGSVRLEQLDFTGSGLQRFPTAIQPLSSLKTLLLSSNQLKGLTKSDIELIDRLTSTTLTSVAMQNNPLVCDKTNVLHWLQQLKLFENAARQLYCSSSSTTNGDDDCASITCSAPARFAGRALTTLTVQDLTTENDNNFPNFEKELKDDDYISKRKPEPAITSDKYTQWSSTNRKNLIDYDVYV